MPFQNDFNLLLALGRKAKGWLAKGQNTLLQTAELICPHERFTKSAWIPIAEGQHRQKPITLLSGRCPGHVGGEQDGPEQPPRATFSFGGEKMLCKVVSEVQKLFSEKNLSKLKFSYLENIVGATRAVSATAIAMWFIHISINGLFLQEVGCNNRGSSRAEFRGDLPALPLPRHLCSRWDLLGPRSPSQRSH